MTNLDDILSGLVKRPTAEPKPDIWEHVLRDPNSAGEAVRILRKRREILDVEAKRTEDELRLAHDLERGFSEQLRVFNAWEERDQADLPILPARRSYQNAPIWRLSRLCVESVEADPPPSSAHPGVGRATRATLSAFERAIGFLIATQIDAPALRNCLDFGLDLMRRGLLRQPYPEMVFEFQFAGEHCGLLVDHGNVCPFLFRHDKGAWLCSGGQVPLEDAFDEDDPSLARAAVALIVLLDSRSTEVGEPVTVQRGKGASKEAPPTIVYRRVTVQSVRGSHGAGAGGHHASPRLHWRRGHLRHLSSGAVVPVSPCIVGSADRGVVLKDYKVA